MIRLLEEVATFAANKPDEAIRISVIEFGGSGIYVDMRLWRGNEPTQHGLRLNLKQLPNVLSQLDRAQSIGRSIADSRKAAK